MIEFHALGQCLIRTGITSITPRADMCFALASYLTRERGTRVSRRTVENFFWPTMRSADAAHSLSELIHKLRGKGVMIQRDDASCIWLPRDAAIMDIDSLSQEPPGAIAERDLSILPGYSPRSSPAFNDWVDDWRDQLRLRVLQEVVGATSKAAAEHDWNSAFALANQALKFDSANETALRIRARAADNLSRESYTLPGREIRIASAPAVAQQLREASTTAGWRTRASMSAAQQDTALVGRELPAQRLRNDAKKALGGDVCAAYISAPAGLGKSRLVREIASWMSEHGAAVCVAPCDRQDSHRPLSVFIQAVPILQSLPGAAGCAPSTIECLTRITHFTSESMDVGSRDSAAQLTASIRASVIDLVDAVADEQPLLLVIEDIHWIDPASWSLLRTIVDKAERSIFLLCTSRLGWQFTAWGAPDGFRLEELPALDRDASRAHVCNYLARLDRKSDDGYLAWCIDTANGNPYFIEELVNYWVTTGEQYSAPPSLVALVEARLAYIRPDALRVIQAAAILGKYSTVDLLQQVLEFPMHTLFSSIEELGEAGLLTASGLDGAASAPVICRHDLIGRAATRTLSAQGRALLHHAAARAMESTNSDDQAAERLWDCAEHWHAAGQVERSISAAIACARHLHDMGLVSNAIKRCEATLAKCTTGASRATVLRVMAQSLYVAHDWRAFLTAAAEVRALENTFLMTDSVHDDLELCELSAQRNVHRDWKAALQQTLKCVHSHGADASHRIRAAITAFSLATNVGDLYSMDDVYHQVGSMLYSAEVRPQDRLMFTMMYSTIRGDVRTSASTARELLFVAKQTLPPRHRMTVMLNCASALRRSGAATESEAVCAELFDIAVRLACYDLASEACDRLIEMHIDGDRIDEARAWVAKYAALRRPKSELRSQRALRLAIARVHAADGNWSAATQLLGSAPGNRLHEDSVPMLQSAALATKLRVEMGRGMPSGSVGVLVGALAELNDNLRTVGAQDYECYSLYLGLRYTGKEDAAESFIKNYVGSERRDSQPLAPEIVAELARLGL
ncbi:MAG: AAA family ATPase [Gemmatimonadaceae bacterium]